MDQTRRDTDEQLHRARSVGRLMDSVIRLPGGYRIGLDGIIGLIPGAGDTVTAAVSSWLIWQGARLGVPTPVLLRMIGNVALDLFVGIIPFLGDLFDFIWKANLRNLELIDRYAGRSSRGEAGDRRLLILIIVLVVAALALALWLGYLLLSAIAGILGAAFG